MPGVFGCSNTFICIKLLTHQLLDYFVEDRQLIIGGVLTNPQCNEFPNYCTAHCRSYTHHQMVCEKFSRDKENSLIFRNATITSAQTSPLQDPNRVFFPTNIHPPYYVIIRNMVMHVGARGVVDTFSLAARVDETRVWPRHDRERPWHSQNPRIMANIPRGRSRGDHKRGSWSRKWGGYIRRY